MVLHAERAAKAQSLGLDVVFDPVVVALGAVELTAASPCRGAAEQSELHELSSGVRAMLAARRSACYDALEQVERGQMKFQRISTQFIAASGNPEANSGSDAQSWGLWPVDPGPRGVRLGSFAQLKAAGGVAPAGWKFDAREWWLEEHGLIMEPPVFPLPPGKYLVTGDREVTTVLTIHAPGVDGNSRWELGDAATLHD